MLEAVQEAKDTLRQLPLLENLAGSPLSYTERLDKAVPMRRALEHAEFVIVPLLTDREIASRFAQFVTYCDHVSGPAVDAQSIYRAVREVVTYGDHVGQCLNAHINGQPLPSEQHLEIPALN